MSVGIDIFISVAEIFIIVTLVVYFIYLFNSLIALRTRIDKARANIDVTLKQRYDELPRIIEVCKQYMKYEGSVLKEITELRVKLANSDKLSEKAGLSDNITLDLTKLFAVAENYPKLRANENFLRLQLRISELENELAERREFYNDSVTCHNIRIKSFPDFFIAYLLRYKYVELFSAIAEEKEKISIQI